MVIPICIDNHWVLSIICFPQALMDNFSEGKRCCILFFDSYYKSDRKRRVCGYLRDYLETEYLAKNFQEREFSKKTIPAIRVELLQQTDASSCGLYVMLILQRFLETPINVCEEPVSMIESFGELDVIKQREAVAKIVLNFIEILNPTALIYIPQISLPTLDGEIIANEINPVQSPENEPIKVFAIVPKRVPTIKFILKEKRAGSKRKYYKILNKRMNRG